MIRVKYTPFSGPEKFWDEGNGPLVKNGGTVAAGNGRGGLLFEGGGGTEPAAARGGWKGSWLVGRVTREEAQSEGGDDGLSGLLRYRLLVLGEIENFSVVEEGGGLLGFSVR